MTVVANLLLFIGAGLLIWVAAGRLIASVDRLARRFRQSGFTVAFFVLGFFTSIGELSVMVNSSITGEPQVSAGNLAGASIGLLLFLVPLTAIMANGISLDRTLNQGQRVLALLVTAFPVLVMVDGNTTPLEGLICLMAYASLVVLVRRQTVLPAGEEAEELLEEVEEVLEDVIEEANVDDGADPPLREALHIFGSALLIFVAGNLLVEEAVYFSGLLGVPTSMIGLVLLSVGTNVPEIVIAVHSVSQGRTGIALGNYLGSSVSNALLFGVLVLVNGGFRVEESEFIFTAAILAVGFTTFFLAARTNNRISRLEGALLMLVYVAFVSGQIANTTRLEGV